MPFSKGKRLGNKIKVTRNFNGKKVTKIKSPPRKRIKNEITNNNNNINGVVIDGACSSQEFEVFDNPIAPISPTSKRYERAKAKEHCRWDELNNDFVEMFSKQYNNLLPSKCCFCEESLIECCVWCKSCGPSTIYCKDCALKIHQNIHFHSLIEVTESGGFNEFKVVCSMKTEHHRYCINQPYTRVLTVISENGTHHQCKIHFCHCECENELDTLLSLDLWPVTPIKPNTVISINLLHLFVALQLEGKISFTSFCEGLAWKTGVMDLKLKMYLNRMAQTDCVDQFRNFRRQLINLKNICKGYSGLEECASCPKEDGSVFYSFDANFGLVLKTSSSKSKRLASRSDDLFVPDDEITGFMEGYDDSTKSKECSNFQAGNNLRSKRKTNKLSVTGIFGASCRHEFPKIFLNMKHGERLGYAVFILDRLLKEHIDKRVNVHVVYDIASVLKSHLQKNKLHEKFHRFKFGIPVFHSYGHKGDCQVKNSIRRLDGFGLMDGEHMERLWSYLRSFSKITKEMTPAHRTDLLSDALMHFGAKKMSNIGKHLVFLHHKAKETLNSCQSEIQSICSGLAVVVNEETIQTWKVEEDNMGKKPPSQEIDWLDWKQLYYRKLRDYNKEMSLFMLSEKCSDIEAHKRKAKRLESSLISLEKKYKIKLRWTTSSTDYRSQHTEYIKVQSSEMISTLFHRCSERLMLLALKKRYADGSAIATRLCKQINKSCTEIKNILASYNTINSEICDSFKPVQYIVVLDVKSSFYDKINFVSHVKSSVVPGPVIKTLIQFYIRKQRALEEMLLVKKEMENTLRYWEQQIEILHNVTISQSSGLKYILCERLEMIKEFAEELQKLFSPTINGVDNEALDEEFLIEDDQLAEESSDEENPSESEENFHEDHELYL
ncbi:uncharacterized protein [Clytia hemisphaerica]